MLLIASIQKHFCFHSVDNFRPQKSKIKQKKALKS